MLIALGHRRGVGKNTVGELLAQRYRAKGHKVQVLSFASALKRTSYELFSWAGMKDEAYYEKNYHEKEEMLPRIGKTVRQVWIEIGNKMREVHPAVWINCVTKYARSDFTILTDGRYPNELDAIRGAGGLVIKVVRDSAPVCSDVADTAAADYANWDVVIQNSGSLSELAHELNVIEREINRRLQCTN